MVYLHGPIQSPIQIQTMGISNGFMAYSDRTHVGTGPGPEPEWVIVYYVKPSDCNLCGNLNGSYTLALYQSRSRSHISSFWLDHE